MQMRYAVIAALSLVCLVSRASAAPQFFSVDVPLDDGTSVQGINSSGTVVGYSYDRRGGFFGFERTPDGTMTDVDVSTRTIPISIDDAADIAGYYFDGKTGGLGHGFFVASNGTVTKFDPPGEGGTYGTRVSEMNTGGTLTGDFTDANNAFHGYLRKADGTFTVFDVPGAGTGASQGTIPWTINVKGAVCGSAVDSGGVRHAFIRTRKGAITVFDAPGAGTASGQGSSCTAVAPDGRALGYIIDGTGAVHAFLRASDGTFTSLDIAGASRTDAGLFDGRLIIGDFHDANGALHGFVRAPSGAIKQIDDPSAGTGSGQGTDISAINGSGVMIGDYIDSAGTSHGYIRLR